MTSVMIVEDENTLREALAYLLKKEGYSITEASDGEQALTKFEKGNIDLIILDLMLPGISGSEVCKRIRKSSNVPIIMLTAKDAEIDKVVGLEIGADDYVTKPYSTSELLARMKAVLRRQSPALSSGHSEGIIAAGPVEINHDKHQVSVRGQKVPMPLKEYELLELLVENKNRVLTRGQIIDAVWGSNYFGDTKTLDVHIKRLRTKIETDPAEPKHLLTVRGVGYKFEE
jgi:two-component system response regulator RegX3